MWPAGLVYRLYEGRVMRISQSCYAIRGSIHLQSCVMHINTIYSNADKDHIWIVLEASFRWIKQHKIWSFLLRVMAFIEVYTGYHDAT